MVFRRHPPLTGKFYSDCEVLSRAEFEINPGDRNDYAFELEHFRDVFLEVKKQLHLAYQRNQRSYNLRKREFSFRVGDLVCRKKYVLSNAPNQISAKLGSKFVLCRVRRKVSNLVYELQNLDNSRVGKWHVKDLKEYMGSGDTSSVSSEGSDV